MTAKLNMRSVQEGVEDNTKKAREMGRKALLAYLGVWGLSYDAGKSIYSDGWKWVETAEKRGEKIELAFVKATESYQKSFTENVDKLTHKVEDGAKQVLDVTTQVEKVNQSAQKYWKQVVGKSADDEVEEIGVQLAEAMNGAADSAQAQVKVVQEAVASPVDAIWSGYDELSVKDISAGLDKETMAQLESLRDYEVANKNRVTVLREIDARMQAMTS